MARPLVFSLIKYLQLLVVITLLVITIMIAKELPDLWKAKTEMHIFGIRIHIGDMHDFKIRRVLQTIFVVLNFVNVGFGFAGK